MAETFAVLTGDTRRFGNRVTLDDGTVVDTTAAMIPAASAEQAAEIAHQIALGHVEHGHPDDVDIEKGKLIQRPFEYDVELSKKNTGLKLGKKG